MWILPFFPNVYANHYFIPSGISLFVVEVAAIMTRLLYIVGQLSANIVYVVLFKQLADFASIT
ncbi:hypothetical protein D3C86_1702270 [compost metagenome]